MPRRIVTDAGTKSRIEKMPLPYGFARNASMCFVVRSVTDR